MRHDSARYWENSDKTNLALVLVELTFRESQTTKKELLRKNPWQLLKKEMSQLLFMELKEMDPNFTRFSGFFFSFRS